MGFKQYQNRLRLAFFSEHLVMKKFIWPFLPLLDLLIQEEQLSVNGEKSMLCTGKLHLGGLPRNSVVRIADHYNMTRAFVTLDKKHQIK